jgi:2-dehydro-3-deoxyphosphooctonate aldolase (KDO 8-P synthase)
LNPVDVAGIRIGEGQKLALIAGPCVIESESTSLFVAERLAAIADRRGIGVIFKSSFLKDNRSSEETYQGPGRDEGLRILERVRRDTGLPLLSDVHDLSDVPAAADVLDVIQIPAYLSQQTRLTIAVAKTGKVVNVKKGQFIAPEDMKSTIGKIRRAGNERILLTERGSSFGYRALVVDMRAIPKMQSLGAPVVMDATHAVRIYGVRSDDPAGGEPAYIETLARAGVAAGADAVFLETHPEPKRALCDAMSHVRLDALEDIVARLQAIREVVRAAPAAAPAAVPR